MTAAVEQGLTAARAGDHALAARCFGEAVRLDPDNPKILAWWGQALCAAGDWLQGTAHIREATVILFDRGQSSATLNLIAGLQRLGDIDGALAAAHQAVASDAGSAGAWHLLATACAQANRPLEALGAVRQAIPLAPGQMMLRVMEADLELEIGNADAARDRLAILLRNGLPPREAFRAHKEMASALDRLSRFDAVFPHLRQAERLAAELPEYARLGTDALLQMLARSRIRLDAAMMRRWQDTGPADDLVAPAFLIGFFRSGTTLAQAILDTHPEITVADEVPFVDTLRRELDRMMPGPDAHIDKLDRLDRQGVRMLRDIYRQRVSGRLGGLGDRLLVDKFTLNTIDVPMIARVFPDAKLIFLVRDPRDVCLSNVLQIMPPTPATRPLAGWRGTADLYAQVMGWWAFLRAQPLPEWIEIRYEALVSDFEGTGRALFRFLGKDWRPEAADFHLGAKERPATSPSRAQVAQPLYGSSVGRWRHYEREMAEIAGSLDPAMRLWDYGAR